MEPQKKGAWGKNHISINFQARCSGLKQTVVVAVESHNIAVNDGSQH